MKAAMRTDGINQFLDRNGGPEGAKGLPHRTFQINGNGETGLRNQGIDDCLLGLWAYDFRC